MSDPSQKLASASAERSVSAAPSTLRQGVVTALSMVLAAGAVLGGLAFIEVRATSAAGPAASALPRVEVAALTALDDYRIERRFAARVEPAREVALSFEFGGTLLQVDADEGDAFVRGQVLATLDTASLDAQRRRVEASRRALEADAKLAELDLGRQRMMRDENFVSSDAFDRARLTVDRVQARLMESDAALEELDVARKKHVLRAPFDGTVGARMLDPGSRVQPGQAVLQLYDDAPRQLRVGLPPELLVALESGARYVARRVGRPDQTFTVALHARRSDVDPATRTVAALFTIVDDHGVEPLIGELAQLVVQQRPDEPMGTTNAAGEQRLFDVPLTALSEDAYGAWSLLAARPVDVAPDEIERVGDDVVAVLHRIAVTPIEPLGERVIVRAAIDDGTLLLLGAQHRVVPGERVRTVGVRHGESAARAVVPSWGNGS